MIELRTLGGLDLRGIEREVADAVLAQPKRAALLVFLGVEGAGGRLVRRDRLFGLLWPEQTESRARAALRQMLYSMKSDLGADLLVTRGDDEVGIDPEALACDVPRFDEAIATTAFSRAVDLFRGPFLAGFYVKGSAAFDQWVDGEGERLGRAYGQALDALAEEAAERGEVAEAVEWLRRLAAHNPYSTRTALKYMEALAEAGDRAGALQYADRLATRVEQDLGAAPSPDVEALAARLRRQPTPRQDTRLVRVRPREEQVAGELQDAVGERYTIVRELGAGGMATVYLAEDVKHGRQVALKVLKPELAAVLGPERFLREIRVTAGLNHPHILPLLDSGEADGRLYYATPFMEGESLRDALHREKQLPIERAVDITTQVADALDYAHRHDVIHRDIKPENILLHDGKALVADFGIAMAVQSAGETRLTETGLSMGTPQYMSPEQAMGERELDGRSDVYSLGAVLYEMLAGEPPHTGPTARAILAKIATDEPRRVAELRETVPGHVAAAVHKALAKLPADRFQRAGALGEALVNEIPILTASDVTPAAVRRWIQDWRSIVLILLTLLFASLAAIDRGDPERLEPQGPTIRSTIALGEIEMSGFDEVVVSPDGSHFAVVGAIDGQRAIYIREATAAGFRMITGTEPSNPSARNDIYFLSFSPAGDWLAYLGGGGLFKIPIAGGTPRPIVTASAGPASWGPSGSLVYLHGRALFEVSEEGGEPVLLRDFSSNAEMLHHPRILPDGSGVLMTVNAQATVLYDIEADTMHVVLADGIDASYVEPGLLLFADVGGGLWMVDFDPRQAEVTGTPVHVASGLSVYSGIYARHSASRNGTLVYGVGGPGPAFQRLMLADMHDDAVELPIRIGGIDGVRWSPDGRAIAFAAIPPDSGAAASTHIFIHEVGSEATPRQLSSAGDNASPVWEPDGNRVAWISYKADRSSAAIVAKTIGDDAPPTPLAEQSDLRDLLDWPTDETMVVARGSEDGVDLTILRLDSTTESVSYMDTDAARLTLRASGDGQLVAYTIQRRLATPELWVRSFPGGGEPLFVGTSSFSPRWLPDGSGIYYWKYNPTGPDTLKLASLQTDPFLAITANESVMARDSYSRLVWDLHPSGDRMVIAESVQERDDLDEVTFVVANWLTHLGGAADNRRN